MTFLKISAPGGTLYFWHSSRCRSDVQVILPGQWIILLEPDVIYNVEEVSGWRGRTRDTAWPGINGMGRNRLAFKHRSWPIPVTIQVSFFFDLLTGDNPLELHRLVLQQKFVCQQKLAPDNGQIGMEMSPFFRGLFLQ